MSEPEKDGGAERVLRERPAPYPDDFASADDYVQEVLKLSDEAMHNFRHWIRSIASADLKRKERERRHPERDEVRPKSIGELVEECTDEEDAIRAERDRLREELASVKEERDRLRKVLTSFRGK